MNRTTPNRMQEHWETVRPFLQREWPRLTEADLDEVAGQYDRLIHKIKRLYHGGEEIMLEAAIKSKLQRFFNQVEKIN